VALNKADNKMNQLYGRFEDAYDDVTDELDDFPGNQKLERLQKAIRLGSLISWYTHVQIRAFRNLNESVDLDIPDAPSIQSPSAPA